MKANEFIPDRTKNYYMNYLSSLDFSKITKRNTKLEQIIMFVNIRKYATQYIEALDNHDANMAKVPEQIKNMSRHWTKDHQKTLDGIEQYFNDTFGFSMKDL